MSVLAELLRVLYPALAIGIPAAYVARWTLPRRNPLPLAGIGAALLLAARFPDPALRAAWLALFALMAVCLAVFLFHVAVGARLLVAPAQRPAAPLPSPAPLVTVLVPARDEARVIEGCLDSVLAADYPPERLEVVVVDDGSSDGTAGLVRARAERDPRVRLVERGPEATRGKAAALNEGLAPLASDFVLVLDADHHLAPDFFRTTLARFRDPSVGGVQARTMGRNWAQSWLTRLVEMDFLGWQYCFLDAKSRLGLTSVSFGSGCVFRTALLQRLGGFDNDLATEDLEVSFRLYEAGCRIVFEPATFTTDELVTDLRGFARQRYRWARGTTQAIPMHWSRFLRGGRTSAAQKLDFGFYPVLLSMMVIPYLQLAVHALAIGLGTRLPAVGLVPAVYLAVVLVCYSVAGLRNRAQGGGMGPSAPLEILALAAGMFLYYCCLFAGINLRAFLDQFVVRAPNRTAKAVHRGDGPASPSVEQRLVARLARLPHDGEPPLPAPPPDVDWERVAELALAHGVGGLVHASLARSGCDQALPPRVRQELLQHRRAVLARNLQLLDSWRAIAGAFDAAGIELMALKGIDLLDRVYPADLRPMFDADLLVRGHDLEVAARLLRQLGYRPLPNPTLDGRPWCTQRSFRHPATGLVLDLHWDLVNVYTYRRIDAYPVEEVWRRAEPDGPGTLRRMSLEDRVLHAAIHLAIHHGFASLLQLVDLAELLRAADGGPDWDRLVVLASAYRVRGPAHRTLLLARELLDAPVPERVLRSLRPSLYRRLCLRRYLPSAWAVLDRRPASPPQLSWGWASVLMADRVVDSVRAMRANAAFASMAPGWDEV